MASPFDLNGKVALITGATRGIGRSIAEELARAGARIALCSRKAEACEEVRKEFENKGFDVLARPCNVSRREELQGLVDETVARWRRIDIVVANAAVNPYFGPLTGIPDEAFDKILATNVKSVLWLAGMTLPGMAERGGGSFIVVGSIGGLLANTVIGAYGISKAADHHLVRNLAAEWGPKNIRVNAIAPGLVKTEFARALWEDEKRRNERIQRHRGIPRLRRRGVHHRAVHRRRRRVYHSVVTGYIRAMDLNYSAEEVAFRDGVRAWLSENLPKDLKDKVDRYAHLSREDLLRWHRILAGKGWVAPAWPKEWGGTGWNVVQRYIFEEELGYVGAPPLIPFGLAMCAPVLLRFGTEAQKKRFLPRIYQGEDFWCQGYSEPGSGSDLASLKTKAVRKNDHYVVNGQKIWTTLAHYADWIFCLVRTDPTSEKRQEGISFLLIDMKTPGVTVRPLMLMDGAHEVNEVFFDDVSVPAENLVHEEGKGWTVAKYLLGYERMNTGRIGESKRQLARLKEFSSGKLNNVGFRDRLSRVEVELAALEITNLRFLDRMRRTGQPPGADVSMLKIKGTEIQQALTELMMQAAGPASGDEFAAALGRRYLSMRKTTIYAGSNEIQRNIIAKMTLGL